MISTDRSGAGMMAAWMQFAAPGLLLVLCGCVTADDALSQNNIAAMKLTRWPSV